MPGDSAIVQLQHVIDVDLFVLVVLGFLSKIQKIL